MVIVDAVDVSVFEVVVVVDVVIVDFVVGVLVFVVDEVLADVVVRDVEQSTGWSLEFIILKHMYCLCNKTEQLSMGT